MERKEMKKRSHYLCSLLLTTTILLTPFSGAMAQDTPDFDLDQVVITATKTPVKLSEAGANVSVITKEEIEKSHSKNVGEVLRKIPGIDIVAQGQAGAQTKIYLNGTDRVLVMVNGRKLSRAEGIGSGRANMDLNYLTYLDSIERIEVIKGNASALYGSDAVGGVVNIITKKGGPNQTTLQTVMGDWGTQSYQLTNQGEEKDFSWLVTAGKYEQDHFSYKDQASGETKQMPNSAYDSETYTINLEKKLDDKRKLEFSYQGFRTNKGMPNNAKAPKLSDHKRDQDHNWDLTYHFANSEQANQQVKVYRNYHDQESFLTAGPSRYQNTTWGGEWQASHQLNAQHLLTGGISYWKAEVDATNYKEKKNMTNTAYYLQDQWQVNQQLSLIPGVRVDHYNQFGNQTTPRLALNYKISPQTDFYTSYAKVFNAPNLDDLYYPKSTYAEGNPNIKPEKGHTYSIGLNHKFDQTMEGRANYYSTKLDDAINWDEGSDGIWRPYNAEEAKINGVEISLAKKVNPYLTVSAGYNYKKIEEKKKTANQYTLNKNFAPLTYKVGISYSKDKLGLDLNGRGHYGQDKTKFSQENYWVWDAALNLNLAENCNAFVKANNLTNQSYEEMAGSPDSLWGPGNYFPMPGRNYTFGVNLKF